MNTDLNVIEHFPYGKWFKLQLTQRSNLNASKVPPIVWIWNCVFYVCVLQEGDGEMGVTSLSGARASGRPVDVVLR